MCCTCWANWNIVSVTFQRALPSSEVEKLLWSTSWELSSISYSWYGNTWHYFHISASQIHHLIQSYLSWIEILLPNIDTIFNFLHCLLDILLKVWSPDMYQLWGGGSPFSRVDKRGSKLLDCNGRSVRLLGVIPEIFDVFRSKYGNS